MTSLTLKGIWIQHDVNIYCQWDYSKCFFARLGLFLLNHLFSVWPHPIFTFLYCCFLHVYIMTYKANINICICSFNTFDPLYYWGNNTHLSKHLYCMSSEFNCVPHKVRLEAWSAFRSYSEWSACIIWQLKPWRV